MIALGVRITKNGLSRVLPDYVLPIRPAKLRNLCIAVGCEEAYNNGTVRDEDLLGKRGRAIVGIERAKRGFGRRNVIVDYVVEKAGFGVVPKRRWGT